MSCWVLNKAYTFHPTPNSKPIIFSIKPCPLQYPALKMLSDQFCFSCIPFNINSLLSFLYVRLSFTPCFLTFSFSPFSFIIYFFCYFQSRQLRRNLKKQSNWALLVLFCVFFIQQFSSKRSGLLSDSNTYLTHIFYSPAQRNVTFLLHWDLF